MNTFVMVIFWWMVLLVLCRLLVALRPTKVQTDPKEAAIEGFAAAARIGMTIWAWWLLWGHS